MACSNNFTTFYDLRTNGKIKLLAFYLGVEYRGLVPNELDAFRTGSVDLTSQNVLGIFYKMKYF